MIALTSVKADGPIFRHTSSRANSAEQPLTLEYVAQLIDQIDSELFRLGTINVKSPDVWGQNRMTKYRAEFEGQMAQELGKFSDTLNAAQRRADLAVLISSTGIGAALNSAGTASASPAAASSSTRTAVSATTTQSNNPPNPSQAPNPPTPPPAPDTKTQLEYLSGRLDNLQKTNLLQLPSDLKVALEPTIHLDEEANYINHLHQLRRISAGDDLTDAPGYGLYLIRMPISLLPGPEVRKGKGALVNIEARHILPPDLLANTFRNVAIMDTTYQLNPLLLKILHDKKFLVPDPSQRCLTQGPAGTFSRPSSQRLLNAQAAAPGSPSAVSSTVSLSESPDLYGYDVLKVLVDAIEKDRDDWYTHDPSVLSWLITELGTAHRFMREQARNGVLADMFQPVRFQQLDQVVQQRNYLKLAEWRCSFLQELVLRRYNQPYPPVVDPTPFVAEHVSVTDVLAYALMVQSVLVDRQLKHDMDIMSQRKSYPCADLQTLTFYDLFPTPEAQQSFNAYVACKWPLHVFSLDPAIDQQNKLDLFSARSELQIALAIALASGTINFNQATSYARQLQLDIETIDLNRIAVGYGAGDTTFGWRFYPRIQTPPTQGNLQRIGGLLLGSNYGQSYIDKNRRIEPGVRECVALIVTPNFIPAIHFTTTANWFDISGHPHHVNQALCTADMLRLSHQVQCAKQTLAMVSDAGHYRPGEVERLADRLVQLESQLPMQDYRVALPFEGDLTGSEIFTSEDTQLNPRLLGWYGESPRVGVVSTVYLLGTNFSVSEYDVIGGGLPATVKLMSRNVMQITISDKARAKPTNDGRLVFDVHTASPNGISNHLFVETDPADGGGASGAGADKWGYSLSPTSVDVTVALSDLQQTRWRSLKVTVDASAKLVIGLSEPVGSLPPAVVPEFSFPLDGNQSLQTYRDMGAIAYDPNSNGYAIGSPQIAAMGQYIVCALDTAGQIAPGKIPVGVNAKPVTITPILPGFIPQRKQIKNAFTLNLKFVYEPVPCVAPLPAVGGTDPGLPAREPVPPAARSTEPPAPAATAPVPSLAPPVDVPALQPTGPAARLRTPAYPVSDPARPTAPAGVVDRPIPDSIAASRTFPSPTTWARAPQGRGDRTMAGRPAAPSLERAPRASPAAIAASSPARRLTPRDNQLTPTRAIAPKRGGPEAGARNSSDFDGLLPRLSRALGRSRQPD